MCVGSVRGWLLEWALARRQHLLRPTRRPLRSARVESAAAAPRRRLPRAIREKSAYPRSGGGVPTRLALRKITHGFGPLHIETAWNDVSLGRFLVENRDLAHVKRFSEGESRSAPMSARPAASHDLAPILRLAGMHRHALGVRPAARAGVAWFVAMLGPWPRVRQGAGMTRSECERHRKTVACGRLR